MTRIFKGQIRKDSYHEDDDAIFVGDSGEPFANEWMDEFDRKQVCVRYWISDTEKTSDELQENHLLTISGSVDADYGDRYSDYTGYLWTDEDVKVGGHDLLEELDDNVGKFIYMEVYFQ